MKLRASLLKQVQTRFLLPLPMPCFQPLGWPDAWLPPFAFLYGRRNGLHTLEDG